MRRSLAKILNEKGQTASEYMLILVVAITIGMAFKKKMEDYILKNPNSIISTQMRGLNNQFDRTNRYQTFQLAR